MTLTKLTLFVAGYVVGAKAGHERYAQILGVAANAAQRLENFSSRRPPGREGQGSGATERVS